jgi:hypothetical protein
MKSRIFLAEEVQKGFTISCSEIGENQLLQEVWKKIRLGFDL